MNVSAGPQLVAIVDEFRRPDAYDHPVSSITFIETHISWLFLTGEYVYKVKKPVNFGFLDYSTLDKREFYCQEEIRLDKRYSPDLYLDVVSLNETPGGFEINGSGIPVEFAVKMRQFPVHQTLDILATNSELTLEMMDELAMVIADFHLSIIPDVLDTSFGSPDRIQYWLNENFSQLNSLEVSKGLPELVALQSWCDTRFKELEIDMKSRQENGYIRECHGDMHLGNLVLIDNHVRIFDGIEFNPELRWIDVISDLAFLIMDLHFREFKELAFHVLNRYLQQTGDYSGLALLGYYQVYRCLVRAKVSALRAQQLQDQSEDNLHSINECKSYLSLAATLTKPRQPMLFITHGYSGSGKSTYAARLADNVGAIHIRSDRERKRLYGLSELEKSGSSTGSGIYQQNISTQVYETMASMTTIVLKSGLSIIVDATFLDSVQRGKFKNLAETLGVPFNILDFNAPREELEKRITKRLEMKRDVSEATVDVLRQQIKSADPLMGDELESVIDVDTTEDDAFELLVKRVEKIYG